LGYILGDPFTNKSGHPDFVASFSKRTHKNLGNELTERGVFFSFVLLERLSGLEVLQADLALKRSIFLLSEAHPKNALVGEPLWLSGKVVKMRKYMESRGPGFAPHPGQPLLFKKRMLL
jgi:hypothetical protein